MGVTNYKDLEIWKKSMDLCEDVYRFTKGFPKDELYGLVSQMRRSGVSIGANIAEGFGRMTNPDFKRFLSISKGSLIELETHIEISTRLGYLSFEEAANLTEKTNILGKMLTRFTQKMF